MARKEVAGQPSNNTSAVEVWDIADGHEPRRLMAADGLDLLPPVERRFLLDEESGRLAAVLGDSAARASNCVIWDVATGREVQRLPGRAAGVTGGGRILLLRDDRLQRGVYTLVRWAGGGEKITIESATEPFVGPDGRTVVAETNDAGRFLCLWDLSTGRRREVLEGQAAVPAPRPPRRRLPPAPTPWSARMAGSW